MDEGVAIFVRRGDAATLLFALDLAMTALVAGERVIVGLFQGGLGAWATVVSGAEVPAGDGPWEPLVVAGRGGSAGARVRESIGACRGLGRGRLEILACGGDAERLGLDGDALVTAGAVDDVVGLPTLWRRARSLKVVAL